MEPADVVTRAINNKLRAMNREVTAARRAALDAQRMVIAVARDHWIERGGCLACGGTRFVGVQDQYGAHLYDKDGLKFRRCPRCPQWNGELRAAGLSPDPDDWTRLPNGRYPSWLYEDGATTKAWYELLNLPEDTRYQKTLADVLELQGAAYQLEQGVQRWRESLKPQPGLRAMIIAGPSKSTIGTVEPARTHSRLLRLVNGSASPGWVSADKCVNVDGWMSPEEERAAGLWGGNGEG